MMGGGEQCNSFNTPVRRPLTHTTPLSLIWYYYHLVFIFAINTIIVFTLKYFICLPFLVSIDALKRVYCDLGFVCDNRLGSWIFLFITAD
jgi:hypothetical protein